MHQTAQKFSKYCFSWEDKKSEAQFIEKIERIDDHAKDGGSEEVCLLDSSYHEPLRI